MRLSKINMLENEINDNCRKFVEDLESMINEKYDNAIQYYSELSKNYAIVGFQANPDEYISSLDIHFDAMQAIEAQVANDLELLRNRMQFVNDILSDKQIESTLRETIVNVKIMLKDSKVIREDLKSELNRYINSVYKLLDAHLRTIEEKLNSLEIDDLYVLQMRKRRA